MGAATRVAGGSFRTVLVANRGEIACRIIRTLRRLGIRSVAVYSEADAGARHVVDADDAVCLGPPPARESYLDAARLLDAARATAAEAIHPGYGFLSEDPTFAERCGAAGVVFIGPTPAQMRAFARKHTARDLAAAVGMPLVPGSRLLRDAAHARVEAARLGWPVLLKATAGGGGIGMQLCRDDAELARALVTVERLGTANFGDGGAFLERWVEDARHVEVQIFGDGRGRVVALGERDCSLQRRNQKVVEETPAPGLDTGLCAELHRAAVRLGERVAYASAGTVEFIVDRTRGEFYFLEVNTRLQVEHGVTEAVTGIDLVEWMVRLAAGDPPPLDAPPSPRGAAIEVRLYAEDPARDFAPSAGLLTEVVLPDDVRVDGWVERGTVVTPFYDPLLAKVIARGDTRADALARLRRALDGCRLAGIETNLAYLREILAGEEFVRAEHNTRSLARSRHAPRTVEVLEGGVHTTVQDWPGRLGYWAVGVPPSGPMDDRALRLGNRVVGNPEGAAALECTAVGPALRFGVDAVVALAGADMDATLDGARVACWTPLAVPAGAVLRLGSVAGAGCRTYVCVRGGLDVPEYLGSRATFTLGRFGGHGGRVLRPGDVLHLGAAATDVPRALPPQLVPSHTRAWELAVVPGPQGAPDFFTPEDVATFFATDWVVHYNSSRTGVRLVGPKPRWARADGGEAGLHPSNIHDNAYAVGTVDFTGDMPIILGPDGPSLGGFVCPATVIEAERWKIGQLRPDDTVRFVPVGIPEATDRARARDAEVAHLESPAPRAHPRTPPALDPVLHRIAAQPGRDAVTFRPCGDRYLLVEYGPLALDLRLRFRVHALATWLAEAALPGVVDVTPGIRSLQIHYEPRQLPLERLLDLLVSAEAELPAVDAMRVPTRIVHLPLSWDDPATRLAIERYMQGVRADAPWCPSNIEFIRRINGLDDVERVREIVFGASYLVLGLGDVYLGAPVATPIDPRHRLVTTKYNPARTWTPENAVGIGGAYLCIYGMEGPGGYQFVGRTVQVWNPWRETADFPRGTPWLLRFFDQIRFHPVTADELLRARADFLSGRLRLEVREETFVLADYERFLADNAADIAAFKTRQQASFEAERGRWQASESSAHEEAPAAARDQALVIPPGCRVVAAKVAGNVWAVAVAAGTHVAADEVVVVLESMKMEVPVAAPVAGAVVQVCCVEGRPVAAGDPLVVLRPT